LIFLLGLRLADPGVEGAVPHFDVVGAVLSALGLFFVVLGVLQASVYGWFAARQAFYVGGTVLIPKGGISPVWLYAAIGALFLLWFFLHLRNRERSGREPLLSTRMFRNRTANLGLSTQLIQWLTLQGSFFVISVYLQTVYHFSAIQTGLTLVPATVGILLTSALAGRFARRRSQKSLVVGGFVITIAGTLLLLLLARSTDSFLAILPGLFLIGAGVGIMLTMSVNVVQSAFPERDQGEISGLSRSISNLGSSLGTAIVGSVLVVTLVGRAEGKNYAFSLLVMTGFAFLGLIAALLLPAQAAPGSSAELSRDAAA
jgi:predicted MFS family arabinose efflux permease